MSTAESARFVREMGISHREFLRLLPQAVKPWPFDVSGNTIVIGEDPQTITLRLSAEGQRRLGLLRLPVTNVAFEFCGFDEPAIRSFMERFELAYRRGGG
ncbi:MAG: hypothetical protein OES78_01240 [Chromatiales bacterium]|nr:hypothetical protein [Chromatiales bacterium]MDH3893159.1 hypothetical protein [Chromatiales bacterium]MDH3931173.1 hypothetical protein [Chromatiales bacterium]MDH4013694.1 hypothetical protein [Chromatiales bacterium]PLX55673.1 MAG: hypothetical protein C0629_11305 [Chromatiales bacterium]